MTESKTARVGILFLVVLAAWALATEKALSEKSVPAGKVFTATVSLGESGAVNVHVPEHAEKVIVVAEGGHCLPGLTERIARFFAEVATALEVGVEPKRGLVDRAAMSIALGREATDPPEVSNALRHAKRVLACKGKDGIEFWAELYGWTEGEKEAHRNYQVTVWPGVGETRTVVFEGCYTLEELNDLKRDMARAAQLLTARVDAAVEKARAALAIQRGKASTGPR